MADGWKQKTFRVVCRYLTDDGLEALRHALLEDDPGVVQGVTYDCSVTYWHFPETEMPVQQCCPLGYAIRHNRDRTPAEESLAVLRREFQRMESLVTAQAGAGYEKLIAWIDEGRRRVVWRELVVLVEGELQRRKQHEWDTGRAFVAESLGGGVAAEVQPRGVKGPAGRAG